MRQRLLERMERIVKDHRDGYATVAKEIIKLCTVQDPGAHDWRRIKCSKRRLNAFITAALET